MTIKMLDTGKIRKVNDSYGLRLITQGKAIPVAFGDETEETEQKDAE